MNIVGSLGKCCMCSAGGLGERKKREGSSWQHGLKPVGQVGWGGLGVPRAEGKMLSSPSSSPLPNTCRGLLRDGHLLAFVGSAVPGWGRWTMGGSHFGLASSPSTPVLCFKEEGGAWIRALSHLLQKKV